MDRAAALHDKSHVFQLAQIGQHVAAKEHEVSALAHVHGADLVLDPDQLRVVGGGREENLIGGHSDFVDHDHLVGDGTGGEVPA